MLFWNIPLLQSLSTLNTDVLKTRKLPQQFGEEKKILSDVILLYNHTNVLRIALQSLRMDLPGLSLLAVLEAAAQSATDLFSLQIEQLEKTFIGLRALN